MSEQESKKLDRDVTVLGKIELAGKIGAASLPLTYVSGYLIATSYIGTYGIRLNSTDLFRAKYIYVGVQYLIFLVLVAAVFRIVLKSIDSLTRDVRPRIKESELKKSRQLLLRREKDNSQKERFRKLRGELITGLMLLVFTVEILGLNPENLGEYLPLQIIFLFGIFIYQVTFYRELREPYTWGLVYGRKYLEGLRWILLWSQLFAVAGLILVFIHANGLTNDNSGKWVRYLALGTALIAADLGILAGASVFAKREALIRMDRHPFLNPKRWEKERDNHKEIWNALRKAVSLREAWIGYFRLCGVHRFRSWGVGGAALCTPWVVVLIFLKFGYLTEMPRLFGPFLVFAAFSLTLSALINVGNVVAMHEERSYRLNELTKGNKNEETPLKSIDQVDLELQRSEGPDRFSDRRAKVEIYARRIVLAIILYITSVLGFAYIVYPQIPVQKAGGNYATANSVLVYLVKETPAGECSGILLPHLQSGESFKVLEEDSDWVYLAKDHDSGGPQKWTFPGFGRNFHRPTVFAINRSCIAGMQDASANR